MQPPIPSGSETKLEQPSRFNSTSDLQPPIPSGSETKLSHHCRFNLTSDLQPLIPSGSVLKLEHSSRFNSTSDSQPPIPSGSVLKLEKPSRINLGSDLQPLIPSGSELKLSHPFRSILVSTAHCCSSSLGSQSVGPSKLLTVSSSNLDASNPFHSLHTRSVLTSSQVFRSSCSLRTLPLRTLSKNSL